MSTVLMTSCEKDETIVSNSKLEGTYKGKFLSSNITEIETVMFDNNGVFNISLESASTTSTIKGWYTYDAATKSGVIHHENNTTENFTCTDGEVHIGDNIYCNHPEHKTGHNNDHLAGDHNENHNCGDHDGEHDGHHDGEHDGEHGGHHN